MARVTLPTLTLAVGAILAATWVIASGTHVLTERAAVAANRLAVATAPQEYRNRFVAYGRLNDAALRECSGWVASRRHAGTYWAVNDSGNEPELFAVNEFGDALGVWRVDGVGNVDWEDIALDEAGFVVIADVGDNRRRRNDAQLIRVREPDSPRDGGVVRLQDVLPVRWPRGAENCEALFSWAGEYYLIEKLSDFGVTPPRAAALYRVPRAVTAGQAAPLVPVESFAFAGCVTAADISHDGRRLAVSSYDAVYVFDRRDPRGPFFAGKPAVTRIECGQMESLAFHHDGAGDLLLANEARNVYRLPREWWQAGQPFGPAAQLAPRAPPATAPAARSP